MFDIRPFREADIPEILKLMKASLGDSHGRRNVDFWNWKHTVSPFGKSEVMVAESGQKIIGVRAMMSWEFRKENRTIKAWRAVDTSTDPAFQGKGIFSSLNEAMINHLAGIGPALIFNTPNQKSAKGYLKQGWVSAGQTALVVKPIFENLITNRFGSVSKHTDQFPFQLPSPDAIEAANQLFKEQLTTSWDMERLRWRYASVPGLSYQTVRTENGTVIFRMVRRGGLLELRITELFPIKNELKKDIQGMIKALSPDLVTCLIDGQGKICNFLPSGFLNARLIAPMLVCRKLNHSDVVSDFNHKEWRYFSAGSMELF